jgi:radical SAM superfamily enzyme YgiQ (UPF0313 family)
MCENKKKVLLILSPNVTVIEPFCSAIKKQYPLILGFPLGLGYIASYLLQTNNYEVRILDANKYELSIPQILNIIQEYDPNYIGITLYTINSKVSVALAQAIKQRFPSSVVVGGGPHASDDFTNLLTRYPYFDYVVVGEGEITFKELLEVLDSGSVSKIDTVLGIAYRLNGNVVFTGHRSLCDSIDHYPQPARVLVDFNEYIRKDNNLPYAIEIMGSRGCTHRCVFCSFQKKWRARSTNAIIQEMKDLLAYYPKAKSFLFYDDNFSADKKRVVELCKAIIQENLQSYPSGIYLLQITNTKFTKTFKLIKN